MFGGSSEPLLASGQYQKRGCACAMPRLNIKNPRKPPPCSCGRHKGQPFRCGYPPAEHRGRARRFPPSPRPLPRGPTFPEPPHDATSRRRGELAIATDHTRGRRQGLRGASRGPAAAGALTQPRRPSRTTGTRIYPAYPEMHGRHGQPSSNTHAYIQLNRTRKVNVCN